MVHSHPITIHAQEQKLNLPKGNYYIHILGGWSVTEIGFRIRFIRQSDGKIIQVRRAIWPINAIESGKRSKRYYDFEINESGEYCIEFINPQALVVKRSNLFLVNLLEKPVNNELLSISISLKK